MAVAYEHSEYVCMKNHEGRPGIGGIGSAPPKGGEGVDIQNLRFYIPFAYQNL